MFVVIFIMHYSLNTFWFSKLLRYVNTYSVKENFDKINDDGSSAKQRLLEDNKDEAEETKASGI